MTPLWCGMLWDITWMWFNVASYNFEPLCAILILFRYKSLQCMSFNPYKPCSHLNICFLMFILMSARKETNLYLNLFLNISFVLIYLFCYYHATVIENIVHIRSIMYLAFAIFSIEMYNYHFDQILLYFWGDVFNLLMCLVFLIAVLCSMFSDEKNYVC